MNPLTNMKNVKKLSEQELQGKNKTSWHDQYKSSAWIFVGGLPYELTEGDVICVFSQYGEIVNINLVRDKGTGKSKGFCFICYEDQRSTNLAVDNFNGMKLLTRTIRVDHVNDYKAPKDSKKIDDETRQLYEEGCAPGSKYGSIGKLPDTLKSTSPEEPDLKLPMLYPPMKAPSEETPDTKLSETTKVKHDKRKKKEKKEKGKISSKDKVRNIFKKKVVNSSANDSESTSGSESISKSGSDSESKRKRLKRSHKNRRDSYRSSSDDNDLSNSKKLLEKSDKKDRRR